MAPFCGRRHSCGCPTGYGTEQRRPNRCTAFPEWRCRNVRRLRTGGVGGQRAGIAGLWQADIGDCGGRRRHMACAGCVLWRVVFPLGRRFVAEEEAVRCQCPEDQADKRGRHRHACDPLRRRDFTASSGGASRHQSRQCLTEVHRKPALRPGIRSRSTEADARCSLAPNRSPSPPPRAQP